MRSHVVSRASCAVVARDLELDRKLRETAATGLPTEELERLSHNRNVLAAILEAALAALFLEHGFERVESAVVEAFDARIEYALTSHVDHKTELQEALARTGRAVVYTVIEVEGPPHDRRFTCAAVRRRRGGRPRQRALEEGRRAGGGPRGAGAPRARARSNDGASASPARIPPSARRVSLRPRCTSPRSRSAASSRSRTLSRSGSSPASASSSGRTAPASRTSRTRSSGPPGRSRRTSCAPRSPTTSSSRARRRGRRRTTRRSSSSSTTATATGRSTTPSSRSRGACSAAARGSTS